MISLYDALSAADALLEEAAAGMAPEYGNRVEALREELGSIVSEYAEYLRGLED